MKIMVAMCVAVAALAGTVALLSDGSSDDETRVRNATFASSYGYMSEERSDLDKVGYKYPGIIDYSESEASLSEDDCLHLDRQDARLLRDRRLRHYFAPGGMDEPDVDGAAGYDSISARMMAYFDVNELYERFKILDKLFLLRPYRDAYGREQETFRDLEDWNDLEERFWAMDYDDAQNFYEAMEFIDRLREKCE